MRRITAPLILAVLALVAMTIISGYRLRLRSFTVDIDLTPPSNAAGQATL